MKYITFKNLLIVGLIIVLIYLLTCKHTNVDKPQVITGEQVHDTIRLIDADYKRINDSFAIVLNDYDRQVRQYKGNYDQLLADYLNLTNDIDNTIAHVPYPDTCKPIVDRLNGQFNQLKSTSAAKDKAAANTINSLTAKSNTQTQLIAEKDKSYTKMKAIADTCAKSLTALESYTKKIKPKKEINIGAEINSSWLTLKPIYGVGIGYRDKKGNQLNAAVFSNQTISVGIKKTLFKF